VRLIFSERAWEDYIYWQSNDPKLLARLNSLIKECARTPFSGTGKPEPLRGQLAAGGLGGSPRSIVSSTSRRTMGF
jgi:toxin YoeB